MRGGGRQRHGSRHCVRSPGSARQGQRWHSGGCSGRRGSSNAAVLLLRLGDHHAKYDGPAERHGRSEGDAQVARHDAKVDDLGAGVRVRGVGAALLTSHVNENLVMSLSTFSRTSSVRRTCAGTHTLHSALQLSQISVLYLVTAADSGLPSITVLRPRIGASGGPGGNKLVCSPAAGRLLQAPRAARHRLRARMQRGPARTEEAGEVDKGVVQTLVQEGLDGRGAPVAKALRQRAAHAAEEVVVLRSGWVELAGAGPRLGRLGGTRPGVDSLLPRRSSHQVVLEGAQVDEAKCGEDAIALRAVRGGCKFRHAPE